MSYSARAIIPASMLCDPEKIIRAVENALDGAALAAKADFGVTTQTWRHKPTFTIAREKLLRTISTLDPIYGYVNDGTQPHEIRPKKPGGRLAFGTPFIPKTVPHIIASGPGGSGSNMVYTTVVNHPGNEAREFDKVIHAKWEKELPKILQSAIDSEAR